MQKKEVRVLLRFVKRRRTRPTYTLLKCRTSIFTGREGDIGRTLPVIDINRKDTSFHSRHLGNILGTYIHVKHFFGELESL